MLGNNYSIYKEAGFIKGGNSYQDYLMLHSVPFVTWNNFSTTKQNLRLSANFMGTFALQLARKSGSPMTDFLSNLMQKGADVVINQDYLSQERITSTKVNEYQQLQYDLLFGNQYAYQLEASHKPPANRDYIQGDGPVKITNVRDSDGLLTIEGENFVENDKVYLNDRTIKSTFVSSNKLTATLPNDLNSDSGKSQIQIVLPDSMSKVISQSNLYCVQ